MDKRHEQFTRDVGMLNKHMKRHLRSFMTTLFHPHWQHRMVTRTLSNCSVTILLVGSVNWSTTLETRLALWYIPTLWLSNPTKQVQEKFKTSGRMFIVAYSQWPKTRTQRNVWSSDEQMNKSWYMHTTYKGGNYFILTKTLSLTKL